MSKKLISIFAIFFTAAALFAVDFGGFIENYSLITSEENSQEQTDKLAAWISHSPSDTMYMRAQLTVAYSLDEYDFLFDVDHAYIQQQFPGIFTDNSIFSYQIGRFFQNDFSTRVLAHRLDGLKLGVGLSFVNINVGAGYTGLIPKVVSSLNNSSADIVDDEDDDVDFAPKKIILNAGVSFPELIPSTQIDLAFLAQFDLRDDDYYEDGNSSADDKIGAKLDTFYLGLGFSGSITRFFIYDTYAFLQFGESLSFIEADKIYKDKSTLAILAGGNLSLLLDKLFYSKITASFMFASGDNDNISVYNGNSSGDNTQFMPISESKTGIIFSPIPSNLIKFGIEYSILPFIEKDNFLKTMQTALSANVFYKASDGAVSDNKAGNITDEKYLGMEIFLHINLRPTSDLGIGVAGGAFLPNTADDSPISDEFRDVEPGVMINASFSF